jgi:hypothetical protein
MGFLRFPGSSHRGFLRFPGSSHFLPFPPPPTCACADTCAGVDDDADLYSLRASPAGPARRPSTKDGPGPTQRGSQVSNILIESYYAPMCCVRYRFSVPMCCVRFRFSVPGYVITDHCAFTRQCSAGFAQLQSVRYMQPLAFLSPWGGARGRISSMCLLGHDLQGANPRRFRPSVKPVRRISLVRFLGQAHTPGLVYPSGSQLPMANSFSGSRPCA